jgi:peptide/nickel transport system permease protein
LFAYLSRRLAALFVILLGSSYLIYNLEGYSGDPIEDLRVSTAPNKMALIEQQTRLLHLDLIPPVRYFVWLRGVLGAFVGQFDLGKTRQGVYVVDAIGNAIPTTVRLVLMATIFAIVVGIAIGIITALRQYSRFDYTITFISFLFFSLPVFWVAVLLKQFGAIGFNNFLAFPTISPTWIFGAAIVSTVFWCGVIGGDRRRLLIVGASAFSATALVLWYFSAVHWFAHPGLGPIVILIMSVGVAFGVTILSTGLATRAALYSALTQAALGLVAYFVMQPIFRSNFDGWKLLLAFVATIVVAVASGLIWARQDKAAAVRTSVLTAVIIALLIFVDRMMQSWETYSASDAVNYRPIATVSQANPLLETTNFWMNTIDIFTHTILPTAGLTLISFAGYVRYTRGSMLEVLNQDYIRTARAKGLTERTVIMRHAFRNALIPLTTLMAFDFAGILGGAIITERVFGWIGMGTLFNEAIGGMDLNLLMGVSIITSGMAVLANLLADLIYSALDPRIRAVK